MSWGGKNDMIKAKLRCVRDMNGIGSGIVVVEKDLDIVPTLIVNTSSGGKEIYVS